MDKEIKANATPQPQYTPSSSIVFDKSEYPASGTYDPTFGIKTGRGLNSFFSMIMWLSKDKLTFYAKVNMGPYSFLADGTKEVKRHSAGIDKERGGIYEGVSLHDTKMTSPSSQGWKGAKNYITVSTKNNNVRFTLRAKYRIGTMGFLDRGNAPVFWFGYYGGNYNKYKHGHFTDPAPHEFENPRYMCKPRTGKGCVVSWRLLKDLSGWYEPIFKNTSAGKSITGRGTDKTRSWCYYNSHRSGTKTKWLSQYACEKRNGDSDYWVSDTPLVQNKTEATRKNTYWVWEAEYEDTFKSGGVIVLPNPPSAPILEVDPADGIHGTIRVKYNHQNKPGLDPEPVDITVVGQSEGGGSDTVLFISGMKSGGSQEKDVIFREHGFTEGFHIKYQATAVDSFGQKAHSGWVGGHHYNKTPDAPEGWRANTVVPTETKPYTKIHVTHEPAKDIENDNVTYELKYEFYNEDGSKAVPMKTMQNKTEGDFGEMTITNVSDGGRLEFWSTPADDKEHDRYSDTAHFIYKKGYAAARPEQVWPKEKSIVRNKRPRIIIKNGIRKGMSAPETEQKIFVRWMDTWYNNQDHRQYFSSGSNNVGYYTVFKPPVDCFSVDGKVSVSVKAHNGCTESKTLDRIFFYKEFEHEKVIPLKSNHVNLLKVAIDDERDAYELPPFTYNRDHGPNTNDILVLKDEIVFNEDYNSLAESIIEVNEYINGIDKTSDTDYTNYQIPTIKDLDLIDAEFAEWQKLLTMVQSI